MTDDPHAGGSREIDPEHIRSVRIGHGANCSSIGSVVDTLFATAALGSAVFAAVVAALAKERVVVAEKAQRPDSQNGGERETGNEHVT